MASARDASTIDNHTSIIDSLQQGGSASDAIPLGYRVESVGFVEMLVQARTMLFEFKEQLAPYVVDKGTIRFPLSEPVPVKLIEGIAKVRAKEVAERDKAKAATRTKRIRD